MTRTDKFCLLLFKVALEIWQKKADKIKRISPCLYSVLCMTFVRTYMNQYFLGLLHISTSLSGNRPSLRQFRVILSPLRPFKQFGTLGGGEYKVKVSLEFLKKLSLLFTFTFHCSSFKNSYVHIDIVKCHDRCGGSEKCPKSDMSRITWRALLLENLISLIWKQRRKGWNSMQREQSLQR